MNTKKHYKMFKKGKNWCYMAIATLAVAVGTLAGSQTANADTTIIDNTSDTSAASAQAQDLNTNTVTLTTQAQQQQGQTTTADINNETTQKNANPTQPSTASRAIQPQAAREQDGWQNTNGNSYYYQNGQKMTGQQTIAGKNYYFNDQGQQQKDFFLSQDNHTYYFQKDGTRLDDGFYNNWGHTYYFGKDGARWDNKFYNNWGHTYYFGEGGVRLDDGFYNNWGHTYYFQKDGARLDNGFYNNWGHTYYFGEGGVRLDNGFYNNWGHTYYFGADGARWDNRYYYNWGSLYHFGADGALATNQVVNENGNSYWADANGIISSTNSKIETAIKAAKSQLGYKYVWGGGRTSASIAAHQFDCSSFVRWAYAQAGVQLNGGLQASTYNEIYSGQGVALSQLKRGDLVFMKDGKYNHVILYLGGGYFIHDSPYSKTGGVGINNLDDNLLQKPGYTWRSLIRTNWNGVFGIRRVV
ncbi:NlpC/P60 family protein [Limosilactobacillus caccae]|uniref:NlpC/P60 family protein n=1 Tax=Limosilactobacillus caccae TaxID=1926284 RepID=UPI0009709E34|nr:NlpC/P60 family protein [Limosilactobacillus caccae]